MSRNKRIVRRPLPECVFGGGGGESSGKSVLCFCLATITLQPREKQERPCKHDDSRQAAFVFSWVN